MGTPAGYGATPFEVHAQMCAVCGEEILNQRVVASASDTLCRGCAGDRRYYREIHGSVLDRPLAAEDGTRS